MLKTLLPFLLAMAAGVSVVVQQLLNTNVRTELNSAAWSGVVSYVVGLAAATLFLIALREPVPTAAMAARVPWWSWTGGMFGALYIILAVILVPQLGSATFVALLVAGQLASSVAFDHYGLFGLETRPVDLSRVIGVALLVAGVVLIRR